MDSTRLEVFLSLSLSLSLSFASGSQNGKADLRTFPFPHHTTPPPVFVLFYVRTYVRACGQVSTPPIDPENEEFVLFARSKRSALKNWYPFTIMVGGSQANVLVKAKENEFTEKITGNTLAKTLGATLYKEQDKVVGMVKERVPYLKNAKEMEFAFKIRNKDKPASWMFTDGVEAIPDEEECKGVFDKAAEWAAQFQ